MTQIDKQVFTKPDPDEEPEAEPELLGRVTVTEEEISFTLPSGAVLYRAPLDVWALQLMVVDPGG